VGLTNVWYDTGLTMTLSCSGQGSLSGCSSALNAARWNDFGNEPMASWSMVWTPGTMFPMLAFE